MYAETTSLMLAENSYKIYFPKRYNTIKDLNTLKGMYLTLYGLNKIGEYKELIIRISKLDDVNGLHFK